MCSAVEFYNSGAEGPCLHVTGLSNVAVMGRDAFQYPEAPVRNEETAEESEESSNSNDNKHERYKDAECYIKPPLPFKHDEAAREVCQYNGYIWFFFFFSIALEICKALSKIYFMYSPNASTKGYVLSNCFFDMMFIGFEDIAQLSLLIKIEFIRGEFTENEAMSFATSVVIIIFVFLLNVMDVCKWMGGSQDNEKELNGIRITDDD